MNDHNYGVNTTEKSMQAHNLGFMDGFVVGRCDCVYSGVNNMGLLFILF